jgi:predicted  nucleic acid-binding Zn-ribbon protein
MKGKEAARSANRRHGAAMEHLRQLTEDLASYRVRARDAETEARRLRVRVEQLEHQVAADQETVDGAVRFIAQAERSRKATIAEWRAALGDLFL